MTGVGVAVGSGVWVAVGVAVGKGVGVAVGMGVAVGCRLRRGCCCGQRGWCGRRYGRGRGCRLRRGCRCRHGCGCFRECRWQWRRRHRCCGRWGRRCRRGRGRCGDGGRGVHPRPHESSAMREVDSSVARANHTRSLPLSTIMTSESASDDGMFQHTEPSIVPLVNSSVPDCRLSGINPHEGKYVVGLNVLKTTLLSPTALRSAMNVLDPGPRYLTLTVAM